MFTIGQQVLVSVPGSQQFVGTIRGVGNGEYYVAVGESGGWVSAASVSVYAPAYQPSPQGGVTSLIPPIVQPFLPHPPWGPFVHRPPWER